MGSDVFLWLLGSLCEVLRRPFDPRLAAQAFPPPHDRAKLIAALSELGLRAGEASGCPDQHTPMPCVAWSRDGGAPVLLARADASRVLCFISSGTEPLTLSGSQYAERFEPGYLLVQRMAEADSQADDPDARIAARRFGFRWFVPELLKHSAIWRQVLLASLAIQLVGLATPLFTQVVIDKVVVHRTQNTLWAVAVAMVMFMLFSAVMTWMRQYLVLHTGNRIDAVLGQSVFRHLLRLPMAYFEHRPTGSLVARLAGVESIRQFVAGAAVTLTLDCPFLLVFLAVMFWYSWQLTLVALGFMLLIAVLSLVVTPLFRRRLDHQFLQGARTQSFVTEYVAAMQTVKSLQLEPLLEDRYGGHLAGYLSAGFATRQLANTYGTLANALEQVMTLTILVAGAVLVIEGADTAQAGGAPFTIGMLVAFQMFASRMSQPLLRLVGLWQEFQQAGISVRRLGDVMDMPAEPYSLARQRADPGDRRGRVEFAGVAFRYASAYPWLYRDLDLVFHPGELTVITGPSGCGKSTLARLMQGFYRVGDGRVLVEGIDVRQMSVNELRATFGVVEQETTLFSTTVEDNLRFGDPDAGFDDIVRACRDAGIHDTIEQLPQGYQTVLGERGVGLSGGQRQRIAIARALLKRPRVLIFDEASSNLDAAVATQFAHTVNQLKGKATMIFIAHQVPDGLEADRAYRLGQDASDGKFARPEAVR